MTQSWSAPVSHLKTHRWATEVRQVRGPSPRCSHGHRVAPADFRVSCPAQISSPTLGPLLGTDSLSFLCKEDRSNRLPRGLNSLSPGLQASKMLVDDLSETSGKSYSAERLSLTTSGSKAMSGECQGRREGSLAWALLAPLPPGTKNGQSTTDQLEGRPLGQAAQKGSPHFIPA